MSALVSKAPGKDSTWASRAASSSAAGSGASRISPSSRKISRTESPVASTRTLPAMTKGPGVRS